MRLQWPESLAHGEKVETGTDTDLRINVSPPAAAGGIADKSCTPPLIVAEPNPQLTSEALEHRVQGCKVLPCTIGADGKMRDCKALEPLAHLTESVLASMKQRIYRPSLCGEYLRRHPTTRSASHPRVVRRPPLDESPVRPSSQQPSQ
jgi:hypothetical protein